jgi:hypothetical protein
VVVVANHGYASAHERREPMNAKINKRTLKAAALAAGLIALLLLPTGCWAVVADGGVGGPPPDGQPAPGSAVVAPLHIVV